MDFAFGRYGQIYHTKYDIEAYIPAESHQYLGDNILALLQQLGHAPELNNMPVCMPFILSYTIYNFNSKDKHFNYFHRHILKEPWFIMITLDGS